MFYGGWMRLVFWGTPDFAVPGLKALSALAPQHELAAIVTQPNRPRGRDRRLLPPPVLSVATDLGVAAERIYQPASVRDTSFAEALRLLEPDLFCIIAYGGLLTDDLLAIPRLYSLNAHASLLPRHRGASCISAAIAAGDETSGVTIFKLEKKLDAGPVLMQEAVSLRPRETALSLHDRLSVLAAECFVTAINKIEDNQAVFWEQDEAGANYAPKLTKASGRLDWSCSAVELDRCIRAFAPWPGGWTVVEAVEPDERGVRKHMRLRVVGAQPAAEAPVDSLPVAFRNTPFQTTPGWMLPIKNKSGKKVLAVRCGKVGVQAGLSAESYLELSEVLPESKKPMPADAFLNGAGRFFAFGGFCL
jgi:methionyl-tRNA formyltransferase